MMKEQLNGANNFDTETIYTLTEKEVSAIVWASLISFLVDKSNALAIMSATGEAYRQQNTCWTGTTPILAATIVEMLLDVPEFLSFFGGNTDVIRTSFIPIVKQNIQLAYQSESST